MRYTYSLPRSVSFTGKGLLGYSFGPLKQKDLEIYYIEVERGHDMFMVSRKITRTYYVLSGNGYFIVDDKRYNVSVGMLVEVPPKVEYCYSGKMTLLGISKPRWFRGNDSFTKWNPDVVKGEIIEEQHTLFARLVRSRLFGRSVGHVYLSLNERVWRRLPKWLLSLRPMRLYGHCLHKLARIERVRAQAFSTFFLRNRPELELIGRLVAPRQLGDGLKVAVLGCSTGPEAYSVAWRLRSMRADLRLTVNAVDISRQAVDFAQSGVYSVGISRLAPTRVLERLTSAEMTDLFDTDGDTVSVKAWIREGITWHVGDVVDPEVVKALGQHDIVVANNFLCHMEPFEAERCLRNIARMVRAGGYLFVGGIDLDVRSRVARDLGWRPIDDLIEEIHEGDSGMRNDWPFQYGGVEPFDKTRQDWRSRYAAVFQLGYTAAQSCSKFIGEKKTAITHI